MKDLKGQIAVVTGASRGIGKGTAIALGEKGCTVYVTGRTAGCQHGREGNARVTADHGLQPDAPPGRFCPP